MRLLFLTNLYPPYGKGGYEEWCQEVALLLRKHGHEVIILTSVHGSGTEEHSDPSWVRRELHLEMELASLRNGFQFFTARQQRVRENFETLRAYVRRFQPDAILVWGMWNIVRSLPILAEKLLPGRVIYYMGDYWPTLPSQFEFYWKAPAQHWYTQLPKSILGVVANAILASEELPKPAFERVIFPTIFMRNELVKRGVKPRESIVIYGAADTAPYDERKEHAGDRHNGTAQHNGSHERCNAKDHSLSPTVSAALDSTATTGAAQPSSPPADTATEKITLLWVGRLRSDKGAHVAIKALAKLVHHYALTDLSLLIAGSGEVDYQTFLEYLVRKEQLQPYVTFLGQQPKEAMPTLYQRADIFLFTAIWQEPFGRVLIEAMAAGATVVGSIVGGASEILIENENSLTYPPGDADRLAAQIARLIRAPELRQRLAQRGKEVALEQFDIQRMAMEIEAYIKTVIRRTEHK
ncbi:MAG: glycosyltransferase family 4 protein, partial [Caldilineaceae bacterium]|nr:glycosyltransferase family 4 protein [Caldilineaceae bacterium]